MADASSFTKLVPGFDFLQDLVKNAGAALPGFGQWVAPTLNPEELEKRIDELKTVQFWLEQNARMLGATIQALEVQRMTLSTLKTMNVQMDDLRDSLTLRMPTLTPTAPATPPAAAPAPAAAAPAPAAEPAADNAEASASAARPGVVDPMQWWGALTQQFTQLATNAMKESAAGAAKNLASAMPKPAAPGAAEAAAPAVAASASAAPSAARKAAAPLARKKPASKA